MGVNLQLLDGGLVPGLRFFQSAKPILLRILPDGPGPARVGKRVRRHAARRPHERSRRPGVRSRFPDAPFVRAGKRSWSARETLGRPGGRSGDLVPVLLGAGAMGMSGRIMVFSGYLLRFVRAIASARVAPSAGPVQAKAGSPALVRKLLPAVRDLPETCRVHRRSACG